MNDTNLNEMQVALMQLVFPVGSTYITQEDTNPNTILKFGTWERVKGKVLIGLDENDMDFDSIGKEGGEKKHKLTINELPSHSHECNSLVDWTENEQSGGVQTTNSHWRISTRNSGTSGGNQEHNNLQPYKVVGYMWIRTE